MWSSIIYSLLFHSPVLSFIHVSWLHCSTKSMNTCRIKNAWVVWTGHFGFFSSLSQDLTLSEMSPLVEIHGKWLGSSPKFSPYSPEALHQRHPPFLFSTCYLVQGEVLKGQFPEPQVISVSAPRNTTPISSLLQTPIHKIWGENYSRPWFLGNLVRLM